jgi:hypothetical protein
LRHIQEGGIEFAFACGFHDENLQGQGASGLRDFTGCSLSFHDLRVEQRCKS